MDKKYWEEFYEKQNNVLEPSLFAKYIVNNIGIEQKFLIELGCGNGRDSLFFANKKCTVLAVDQCEKEINILQDQYKQLGNINFIIADFTNLAHKQKFDIIYSRFTLHCLTSNQERRVLKWVQKNLNSDGMFCIEARGQKNEIYGKGKPVKNEPNAFIYNDHYRRFLNFNILCKELELLGFSIDYADEKNGFAPFKGEDETYIRVIARK